MWYLKEVLTSLSCGFHTIGIIAFLIIVVVLFRACAPTQTLYVVVTPTAVYSGR
jgi:hypothetical protein